MQILDILKQIMNLPLQAAQAILDLVQKGTAENINLTVTVGGRKVGLETRVFLAEAQGAKGAQPAAPATP